MQDQRGSEVTETMNESRKGEIAYAFLEQLIDAERGDQFVFAGDLVTYLSSDTKGELNHFWRTWGEPLGISLEELGEFRERFSG